MTLTKRTRGYLPHWESEGGTYFVTFHLADSLPATVLAKLTRQREMLDAVVRSGRQLTPIESVRAHQLRLDNPRRAGLRDWPWVYGKGR